MERDLFSGLTDETRETSHDAAVSVAERKDSLRERVFGSIASAGLHGHTDDELQALLGLDGSTERPRRWELWKADRIRMLRIDGDVVTRLTRTRRRAVVWVATPWQQTV